MENSNSEGNAQDQSFDNSISPFDPFLEAESIGLRQSDRIKEIKEQRGSRSISAGALCKLTKAISLVAIQLSSFRSAILHDENQGLGIYTQ